MSRRLGTKGRVGAASISGSKWGAGHLPFTGIKKHQGLEGSTRVSGRQELIRARAHNWPVVVLLTETSTPWVRVAGATAVGLAVFQKALAEQQSNLKEANLNATQASCLACRGIYN